VTKERGASIIFLIVGLYGLVLCRQLPLGDWRDPGPGFLPFGLSILLIASGVLWLIWGKKGEEGKKKEKIIWREAGKKLLTPAKILAVTVVFILLLERTGYLLTSFLYVFILFFGISRFPLWVALGLALIIGLGSWYFFGGILSVPLPRWNLFNF